MSRGRVRAGQGDHPGGALRPVPRGQDLDQRGDEVVGDGPVGARVAGGVQHGAQPGAPAQAGEAAQGPAGLGRHRRRDLARHVDAQRLHPRRPHPARADVDTGTEQPGPRLRSAPSADTSAGQGCPVQLSHRPHGCAAGSSSCWRRYSIRQPRRAQVVEHGLLLPVALGRHRRVALGVVDPRLPGGRPAAADLAHRAVHVQDLEHHLQPGPAQVDPGLQRAGSTAAGPPRRARRASSGPAARAGTPARRSRPRCRGLLARAGGPPRPGARPGPPGRSAGSRRPATAARPGGPRSRGRACRSPCPARWSPPAP